MLLKILTPEREIFSGDVKSVTLPTQDGEITVLAGHIPLVSLLKSGEILIRQGSETIPLAVSGGMIKITGADVTILADSAERVEEIIEERARQAHERAQKLLEEKRFDAAEYAAIAAKMEKEMARLKVVRKHRHKGHGALSSPSAKSSE